MATKRTLPLIAACRCSLGHFPGNACARFVNHEHYGP